MRIRYMAWASINCSNVQRKSPAINILVIELLIQYPVWFTQTLDKKIRLYIFLANNQFVTPLTLFANFYIFPLQKSNWFFNWRATWCLNGMSLKPIGSILWLRQAELRARINFINQVWRHLMVLTQKKKVIDFLFHFSC